MERIEFCEWYLKAIGVSLPVDLSTTCYIIEYNGCAYVLTGSYVSPCPPPIPPYPTNVGSLLASFPYDGNPCCRPAPVAHYPPGGIADLTTEGGPVILPDATICEDTVAECFEYKDQFGTRYPVTVSSNATGCFNEWGVPYYLRCNTNRPETIASQSVAMSQDVGLCYQLSPPASVAIVTALAQVPVIVMAEYEYTNLNYAVCPDCLDALQCCAENPEPNPCDIVPEPCVNEIDASESYYVLTKYKPTAVQGDYFVADCLELSFSACYAQEAGLDITDPADFAAIEALYFGKVTVTNYPDCSINTGWGVLPATCIDICDYRLNVFSGNSEHIADRVNNRLAPLVSAGTLYPYFWFGNRQGCFDCGDGPNVRPPSSLADFLFVDRIEIDVATFRVRVILRGQSQRYRACVCQRLQPYAYTPDGIVQNASVSLDTLSPAEYGAGQRYTMARVYEPAGPDVSICTDNNFYVDAPGCLEVPGYPLDNVYDPITGLLLLEGWHELCGLSMCDPKTACHSYPFIYDVCACDDLDCELIPCVQGMFQDPAQYCLTSGDVIQVD